MNLIGIFAGTNIGINVKHGHAARELGIRIAKSGYGIVYGGTNNGLMQIVANAVNEYKGSVVGVVTPEITKANLADKRFKIIEEKTYSSRKEKIWSLSNGCIALPGGLGTLDEVLGLAIQNQFASYHCDSNHRKQFIKPLGVLNIDGFYDKILAHFDECVKNNYLRQSHKNLIFSSDSPAKLLQKITEPGNYQFDDFSKWEQDAQLQLVANNALKLTAQKPLGNNSLRFFMFRPRKAENPIPALKNNSQLSQIPTIEEWLACSKDKIKTQLEKKNLSIQLAVDGTRRHYQINTNQKSHISDYRDYAKFAAQAYSRVFKLIFSYGLKNIYCPLFIPDNFLRNQSYLEEVVGPLAKGLLNEESSSMYKSSEIKVRVNGDYDSIGKQKLTPELYNTIKQFEDTAKQLTPTGEKTLVFGFNTSSYTDRLTHETVSFYKKSNREPTKGELKEALFPEGLDKIDIYIGTGWLKCGVTLPSILDEGKTDLYFLNYLPLDLTEKSLRLIIYDFLFHRRPEDYNRFKSYNNDDIDTCSKYYQAHSECVTGLGNIIGPKMWYPDHSCTSKKGLNNQISPKLHETNIAEIGFKC